MIREITISGFFFDKLTFGNFEGSWRKYKNVAVGCTVNVIF